MGVGLHYASKYQVIWEGGYFDYNRVHVYKIFTDNGVYIDIPGDDEGENSEAYQIPRSDLRRLYQKLKIEKEHGLQIIEEIPIDDFLYFLERAIKSSDQWDDWVHFYWF